MNFIGTKSLLVSFTETDDDEIRCEVLSRLTAHAALIVERIIAYKTRGGEDSEEIFGDVMLQLVGRLQRLREGNEEREISDFDSYVAVVTYNACDRFLSRKYPNRRRLKNGLRYLMSHREGLAVWQDENGDYVGGFRRWQFGEDRPSNPRITELRADTRAFARDVRVEQAWRDRKDALELLTAIFDWTDSPVPLDLLTTICADWWNVTDETFAIDIPANDGTGRERPGIQIADPRADVYKETERRDYLSRLWKEIADLPMRQRSAVLLNLKDENGCGVIDLWLVVGVVTAAEIAAALEMTPERFAGIWNSLPLDDKQVAEMLGLTRQQVINLRKSARERLVRRMKGF